MNVQTSDPEILNPHVKNCVDFQKSLTSFSTVLDEYPDETVMCNVFTYSKHKCDSIYAEAEFFEKIHEDQLEIGSNIQGGTTELKNNTVSIAKLYGTLNDTEFLVLDLVGNPQFRNDDRQVLIENRRRDKTSEDETLQVEQKWKDIEPLGDDTVNLQQSTGLKSLETWFVMYWLERWRIAHREVRANVESVLGTKSIFYQKFSESVGSLKNVEFIKQHSTTRLEDIESSEDIPYTYNSTLNYIVSDSEKRIALNMSKSCNSILRRNIANIKYNAYTMGNESTQSTKSHAINTVTDTEHYKRMEPIKGDIHTVLQNELQNMYDVLLFISNNVNKIKIPAVLYTEYIEGLQVDVDILKNKAKKLMTGLKSDYLLKVSS